MTPAGGQSLGPVPRGECVERSLPPGRYGLRLAPRLEFTDGDAWASLELSAGGRAERSFQEPAFCFVRLLIVDGEKGAPIRGAQVGLERPSRLMGQVSDPNGSVEIAGLPCDSAVLGSVYNLSGTYAPVSFSAETGSSDVAPSVVRLSSRPCQRTLEIVDSTGRPLSGVEAIVPFGMRVVGTSDDEGWLRFLGCESPSATFSVRAPGRALVALGPTEGLEGAARIELPEPAEFELGSRGDGVVESVGVRVGVGWRSCEANGGEFLCSHEGDEAALVSVLCRDSAGEAKRWSLVVPRSEERVEVACPRAVVAPRSDQEDEVEVEGRVVDKRSRPVPGISVGILGGSRTPETLSDLDGFFALSVKAAQDARLLVTATWGPERWASRLWPRGEEGDFVLELPQAPPCEYLWVREVGDRSVVVLVGWQTPAWDAGIRPGDVVRRVRGIDTRGLGTPAVDALLHLPSGTTTTVDLLGPGGELRAELACP